MFNPYLQVANQAVFNQQSIIRVNGIDGAKAYQMQPNGNVALFDSNEDYFYIKTTDNAGFATLRKFSFVEETEESPYVTRSEFNELKEMFKNGKFNISKSSKEATDK